MKGLNELKVKKCYWCWWKSRWMWYVGKAYNAKDYEFEDAGGLIFTLNEKQVLDLRSDK